MIHKSVEEKKRLMRFIFSHLNALPEKEIKQAVILVSYTDDHAFAFRRITGKERLPLDKHPFFCSLDKGIKLIDPTTSFLRPEADVNFVTMHYVMKMVEKAKFVFVFNASETQEMPFDNIKRMLTQFVSLFKLQGDALERLTKSCGMLITDATASATVYSERLVGKNYNQNLLEQDYLPKEYANLKPLVRGMIENGRMLLCSNKLPKEAMITTEFVSFVETLKYFDLRGSVFFSLQSAYHEFIGCRIYEQWDEVFRSLYNSMDTIILDKEGLQERELVKLISAFDFDKRRNEVERPNEFERLNNPPKEEFKSIKLLKILLQMINLIMRFVKKEVHNNFDIAINQSILEQFLDIFYQNGFIKNPFIKIFFMSYFLIRKFLSKEGMEVDSETDLFHRVSFCEIVGNPEIFHPKMREICVQLLKQLEKDLAVVSKNYPARECLNLLNEIIQFQAEQGLSFFTDRVTKKLLKYRASVAYSLIKQAQRNKQDHLRSKLDFLKWSAESRLIKDKLKTEILIDIALTLADDPSLVTLALKILQMLPEYEIYQHVRHIYEKQLKLNVEVLQYLPEEERRTLLQNHFEGYYTFFLKIGFQETVREMSMECLRLSENEEERQYFKRALVKARGTDFRDLHNSFLESSILQEKEVQVSRDFIEEIEKQMAEHGLI